MTTLNRHWHPLLGAFALCLGGLAIPGCTSSNGTSTTGGSGTTTGAATTSGTSSTGGTTGATTTGAGTSGASSGGSSGGTSGGTSGGLGSGNITSATLQAQGGATATFSSPFDAALTADGTKIYFTAIGPNGSGVFSTAAPSGGTGGTVTQVSTGTALEAPFGIALSTDEQTLYVADPSMVASQKGLGAIASLSASSGAPLSVAGSEDTSPQSLAVVQESGLDQIYFTGLDPTDGSQAILKVPAAGGSAIVLAKGSPFVSLAGIAVAGSTVYALDNGTTGTTVYALDTKSGTSTALVSGLRTNFPGGIAVVQDGTALLVAALDPVSRTDSFARVVIASKTVTYLAPLTPLSVAAFGESGGLHRSANSDTYAWVDGTANSGGIVTVLK